MGSYREATRRFKQGANEKITYMIDVTPWGLTPVMPAATLYDETSSADVSATKLQGSPSVMGNNVMTPKVISLVANHLYRMQVTFTCADGNTYETFGYIEAEA